MKVSKRLKITNIQIDLDGKDPLILSLEEAKDLYEALEELFGKEEKIKLVPIEKQTPSYPLPRDRIWYSDSIDKTDPHRVVGDSKGNDFLNPERPL